MDSTKYELESMDKPANDYRRSWRLSSEWHSKLSKSSVSKWPCNGLQMFDYEPNKSKFLTSNYCSHHLLVAVSFLPFSLLSFVVFAHVPSVSHRPTLQEIKERASVPKNVLLSEAAGWVKRMYLVFTFALIERVIKDTFWIILWQLLNNFFLGTYSNKSGLPKWIQRETSKCWCV